MAETLIFILAEHNVPINFADKLVSNKLHVVFQDSVFLRACAPLVLTKSSHHVHCH